MSSICVRVQIQAHAHAHAHAQMQIRDQHTLEAVLSDAPVIDTKLEMAAF